MTTYALTIGPVYRTLHMARKTRELWAASYSFSWMMKQIAHKIHADYATSHTLVFFKPAIPKTEDGVWVFPENQLSGAGLFPDHLIFSAEKDIKLSAIRTIADEVLADFSKNVFAHLAKTDLTSKTPFNHSAGEVNDFIKSHFYLHVIKKELVTGETPILTPTELIQAAELHQPVEPKTSDCLAHFFSTSPGSFLATDAFGGKTTFDHLPEIAVREFWSDGSIREELEAIQKQIEEERKKENRKALNEDDGSIYIEAARQWVENFNQKNKDEGKPERRTFQAAHKYVAIVKADGDNIGQLLKSLPGDKLGDFSTILTQFSASAAQKVAEFGGQPVYFGGDDALFFAPVVNGVKGHVFQLLADLDADFQGKFKELGAAKIPTLSFGCSISFYKFPLYEALEQADRLLEDVAKEKDKAKKDRIKNNLAFRLLKHSGSAFQGRLHLGKKENADALFRIFADLLDETIADPDRKLNSVTYKIRQSEKLFGLILGEPDSLKNFFDNSFNEAVHQEKGKKDYFGQVAGLSHAVYKTPDAQLGEPDDEPIQTVYHLLKTVQFLTADES